jgi:hypothetical protein
LTVIFSCKQLARYFSQVSNKANIYNMGKVKPLEWAQRGGLYWRCYEHDFQGGVLGLSLKNISRHLWTYGHFFINKHCHTPPPHHTSCYISSWISYHCRMTCIPTAFCSGNDPRSPTPEPCPTPFFLCSVVWGPMPTLGQNRIFLE